MRGLPVHGGDVTLHLATDGHVDLATTRDLPARLSDAVPRVTADEARAAARRASGLAAAAATDRLQLVAVAVGFELRAAWEVWVATDDPPARWRVFVDAADGRVLRAGDLVRHVDGTGRGFTPNPVVALRDGGLLDLDDADAAVPLEAYTALPLPDLQPAADGLFHLEGPFARARDLEPPFVAPPTGPSAFFTYGRGNDAFEWVMAYAHTDGLARYYGALGFSNLNDRPIAVDAHGLGGARGAHYVPDGDGSGHVAFGDGGVDAAEDGEVILHELGHATLDGQCPNCFADSEAAALGEGFADFLAAAYFVPVSGGHQDACIGDWYARGGSSACVRRIDGAKRYPDDLVGGSHADGEIWSGLLWDLLGALSGDAGPTIAARDTVVTLALESHYLLAPDPTFFDAAHALLDADALLNGAAHRDVLTAALALRGLLPPANIFGGGKRLTDCAGLVRYANPHNPAGRAGRIQRCADGDPTCDGDQTPGQCTFRMAVCFAQLGLSGCVPQPIERFVLDRPRPDQRQATPAAIAEALIEAVAAIPGATRKANAIAWTPYLDTPACTAPVDLVVPLSRSGDPYRKATLALRTITELPRGYRDTDRMRFSCVPAS